MMADRGLVPIELIQSKIVVLREEKVMIDRDLAELYSVETKQLKRAVRRNLHRFPADFMFELTINEYQSLRSQNVILKRGQHSKYPPFAFSEQGVAMLSSALNSERAILLGFYTRLIYLFARLLGRSCSMLPRAPW